MNIFEGTIPDLAPFLKNAAQRSSIAIQGFIGQEFGERELSESYRSGASDHPFDASTEKNSTDVLRVASGRLLKSFQTRGNKPSNEEGIFDIKLDASGIVITIGTKVEYAAIHEFGAPAKFVASKGKMHKHFWRKYYVTHEEKYKWAALSVLKKGGINMKAVRPRPYFFKAIKEFESQGLALVMQHLADEVLKAMNNA